MKEVNICYIQILALYNVCIFALNATSDVGKSQTLACHFQAGGNVDAYYAAAYNYGSLQLEIRLYCIIW